MKYRSGSHFRDAIEAHLRTLTKDGRQTPERLRKEIAFDRLLARLLLAAPNRWVLKGGLALDHRLGDRARTTKDMDLGWRDDLDAATADLQRAAGLDLGDYFSFNVNLTTDLSGLREEGVAARYRVEARLGGRVFENVVVDVGFDAPASELVDLVAGRDLLAFAGIPAEPFPTLPLPLHVSEKVHAYTRSYGEGKSASTRVKDLIDLVLIATSCSMSADALANALTVTFNLRGTQPLPNTLPLPSGEFWISAYAAMAARVGLDRGLTQGHAIAATFLDPVLNGTYHQGYTWDPGQCAWIDVAQREAQVQTNDGVF